MSGRRACVTCGATYHIVHIPPKKEGVCDTCGSELILRDDDKPETVKNRLDVYHKQIQPLIDFYTKMYLQQSLQFWRNNICVVISADGIMCVY